MILKTIYRLCKCKVVDWTVEDFFRNIYEVEWNDMPCKADLAEQIGSLLMNTQTAEKKGRFIGTKFKTLPQARTLIKIKKNS